MYLHYFPVIFQQYDLVPIMSGQQVGFLREADDPNVCVLLEMNIVMSITMD